MRNYSKIILMSIAFVMFFSVGSVAESQGQQLNEIYKRMQAHRNALSSLVAGIRMAQTDTVLDETDVYSGMVKYLPTKGKEAYVRIDWKKPLIETLAVANGKYVIYTPRRKQAIVGSTKDAGKGSQQNSALAFMNMSSAELRANYLTAYLGVEKVGGKDMWHLNMVPKKKTSYKMADLWVDGNGMPIQVKITENNDDTKTILLSNLQKNITIKASDFRVDLPKGTKIIR
ncbi:MAG: outer membrane lipoprotein carrier protein LolA [Pyrinomonadaceae bacterium]|nr:outer membrane lipoprotein carrier protein LolA [Pyrinomonadaceae bacterium]